MSNNNQGVISTVKTIVTSALFRLRKPTSGDAYTWLEQVAVEYLGQRAPMDGNVSLKCMYYTMTNSARVAAVPPDCMRISRIALRSGNRVWTLTLDNNLAIPENIFDCNTNNDVSSDYLAFWPQGPFGWWSNPSYNFTRGGGQNIRYYRIVEDNGQKLIIFDHGNMPDGQVIIEYLSNGSDISGETMINVTYSEPFRLYLMSQYCMFMGNREEKAMYKELQNQYESSQWEANTLANASRIYELIDGMAQSSEFNLG